MVIRIAPSSLPSPPSPPVPVPASEEKDSKRPRMRTERTETMRSWLRRCSLSPWRAWRRGQGRDGRERGQCEAGAWAEAELARQRRRVLGVGRLGAARGRGDGGRRGIDRAMPRRGGGQRSSRRGGERGHGRGRGQPGPTWRREERERRGREKERRGCGQHEGRRGR
ncbi:uncharacterized protein LOC109709101 [Ananas comosus]|uniref:Uncharacterized protein LOC109709101 n=1 Tax=Ananas comosus TaxID=4615 RepID=A0A6P5F072_ANACO|nr:uncharacterized protein LOC109709101 [Ananas comosus]